MASTHPAKYLKLFDIQAMLKYVFLGTKRPGFIQLQKKPSTFCLFWLRRPPVRKSGMIQERPGSERDKTARGTSLTTKRCEYSSVLSPCGVSQVAYINENASLEDIFGNMLRSLEVVDPRLDVITPQGIKLVPRHDIVHLFSYSNYIKSQTDFDKSLFVKYKRPSKRKGHFLVAIDCEMVITTEGKSLGRVTLLGHSGQLLLDVFIRPSARVVDYLEKYSGLNEDLLKDGIGFEEAQRRILEYVGEDTCLVGHGLENDLESVEILVENIIDTSYLFLNSEGYKVKLAQLTKKYFGDTIQCGPHSSIEDAASCLKLLAYKIQQLTQFYSKDTEEIDLAANIVRVHSVQEAVRERAGKNMVFADIDELDVEAFKVPRGFKCAFLFEDGTDKFFAF